MSLTSQLLAASDRLREAYAGIGRKSLKPSPTEERDATRRIQKVLLILEGQHKVRRFFPQGFDQEPNGIFGPEMVQAVTGYQQRIFPGQKTKHDGLVGKETLEKMDLELQRTQQSRRSTGEGPQHHGGVGLLPTDVLVYMSGVTETAGQVGDKIFGKQEAASLGDQAPQFAALQRGGRASRFVGVKGSLVSTIGVERVVESITRDYDAVSKLIMYGFSAGAKQLLDVCQILEDRNGSRKQKGEALIKVDLLITVDAAFGTVDITRVVVGCVRRNVNYFQRNIWPNVPSAGPNISQASKLDGRVCQVENIELTAQALAQVSADIYLGHKKATPHGKMAGLGHSRAMPVIRAELGS